MDILHEDGGENAALEEELEIAFTKQLGTEALLSMSKLLQAEFRKHLVSSPQCMLPSLNYKLPTGKELGEGYLALEVGGSNLRMALVDLRGRNTNGAKKFDGTSHNPMLIQRTVSLAIDDSVRRQRGTGFFDWIACKIKDFLHANSIGSAIRIASMGIAWAFPIEQTSVRSGIILGMGKGFACSEAVTGKDLGVLISEACAGQTLKVHLDAIVNDSASTLLARAYVSDATFVAVILGTGMNAALYLPVSSFHKSRFGAGQPPTKATHVVTNAELSMFGLGMLPTTRWDEALNAAHSLPGYQPFEYRVAGRYIGEIARLVIEEDFAQTTDSSFTDRSPAMGQPYSLDAITLAEIETDKSPNLARTTAILYNQGNFPMSMGMSQYETSFANALFVQKVIRFVVDRSAKLFAVGVHALVSLLQDLEDRTGLHSVQSHIDISCDGSIINKYPQYLERVQSSLDTMVGTQGGKKINLTKTQDSAVLGAAVAAAMAADESP